MKIFQRKDPSADFFREIYIYDEFFMDKPNGFLPMDEENLLPCMALFYYAIIACRVYSLDHETIVYEEEHNVPPKYHHLFKTIAANYGIDPERAANYWKVIDLQFKANGWNAIPNTVKLKNTNIILLPIYHNSSDKVN